MNLKTLLFGKKVDLFGDFIVSDGKMERVKEIPNRREYVNEVGKCNHTEEDFEQSHDAFRLGDPQVKGYRTHPDIPLTATMNRHQFCRKCGEEKIFQIDSYTGLRINQEDIFTGERIS